MSARRAEDHIRSILKKGPQAPSSPLCQPLGIALGKTFDSFFGRPEIRSWSGGNKRESLRMRIPLHMQVITEANVEATPSTAFLEAALSRPEAKDWTGFINEFSCYDDLVAIAAESLGVTSVHEEAGFYACEGSDDLCFIEVGWAHGTPWWPLACAIVSSCTRYGLFSLCPLEDAVNSALDSISDENLATQQHYDEDAFEELELFRVMTKDEPWRQPWWNSAMKELWRNELDPVVVAETLSSIMPRGMLDNIKETVELIKACEPVILPEEMCSYGSERVPESEMNGILWDREMLTERIDDERQCIFDNMAIINGITTVRLEAGRLVFRSGEEQAAVLGAARRKVEQLVNELESWARKQ